MKILFTILLISTVLLTENLNSQVKKVLFEEFTNASCGPCAANNPFLKQYLDSKGDSIIAIKYHTEFPGFDPMYNLNPTQVNDRRTGYYSDVNAVPWLKGDGNMFPDIWPFTLANFDAAFNTRKVIVPPLTISVTDERIPGDSIKATINFHITQTLTPENYKLRVMAVEKVIIYPTPPGNNGERIFEHVFRRGYPGMQGVDLPTAPGSYVTVYKYKIEPQWVDTSMKTVAFVQNDASNKEVINCALGRSIPTSITNVSSQIPKYFSLQQNFPNPFNPSTIISYQLAATDFVTLKVYTALGNEVATLVNQKQNAGSYSIEFDGSNLSSGMYFYKIVIHSDKFQSNNFSDMKKMMLLK